MTLYFDDEFELGAQLPFDEEEILNQVVLESLKSEDFPTNVEISVSFVTEKAIQDINHTTRDIDRVTDVLSFPMLEFIDGCGAGHIDQDTVDINPETDEMLLGDIVLCIPKVIAQAKEYGHSIKREYAFLIAHSMLHLMGYDHMSEEDRLIMEDKQRLIMDKLGISRKE